MASARASLASVRAAGVARLRRGSYSKDRDAYFFYGFHMNGRFLKACTCSAVAERLDDVTWNHMLQVV